MDSGTTDTYLPREFLERFSEIFEVEKFFLIMKFIVLLMIASISEIKVIPVPSSLQYIIEEIKG